MGVSFFLSYARRDDKPDGGEESTLARVLFEAIAGQIGDLCPEEHAADGSFIDVTIPLGARWEQHIRTAVCTCDVLVALTSPRYFQREWCGKEWAIFDARMGSAEHAVRRDSQQLALVRGRILPLIWIPHPMPPVATWTQNQLDDHNQAKLRRAFREYQDNGLLWLTRFRDEPEYRLMYARVVREIAAQVIAAAMAGALPPHDVTAAGRIPAAFPAPPPAVVPAALPAAPGPDEEDDADAHFFAVVATHGQIQNAAIRARYADNGWRWRPFVPGDPTPLFTFLMRSSTEEGLLPRLHRQADLVAFIRRQESRGRIVLVMVDPWSITIDQWLAHARSLDRERFRNCSIVVVWGDAPADVPDLVQQVRRNAFGLMIDDGARCLREVHTPAELTRTVAELLQQMNARLAPLRQPLRPLPGSPNEIPKVNPHSTLPRVPAGPGGARS